MKPRSTRGRRVLLVGFLGVAGAVLLPSLAWADVTITPDTGTPGSYVREAFQVPNERNDATTTQVQVFFPLNSPLASVAVEPVPGWSANVRKTKLDTPIQTKDGTATEAVSSITWTGGSIAGDQFQEFPVTVGPLPPTGVSLAFQVLQTYSNGDVDRWIDIGPPEKSGPPHPAPILSVQAPAGPVTKPATTTSSDGTSVAALAFGIAGLLAGLAALGWIALGRWRSSASPVPAQEDAGQEDVDPQEFDPQDVDQENEKVGV
jgi:uncharacterized protein YcnI